MNRIGIYFTHALPLADELRYARLAEEKGFDAVWQGQSRYHRDSIVPLAAYAAVTNRIKLGTGVLHAVSRNVVMLAVEFLTLDELSKGRAILGISAPWNPMAQEIGIVRKKPLLAVEEYVTVLKKLFNGESVTFDGEYVHVANVKLGRKAREIPVYVGATGFKMIELAGRIADGVVLNYLISPEYTRQCVDHLMVAARERDVGPSQIDRPQLLACSLDEDYDKAISRVKPMVAEYLAKESHIAKACGASKDSIEEAQRIVRSSPTEEEGFRKAAPVVDDELVKRIAAVGDAEQCLRKVQEYVRAGCTCPLLHPLGENVAEIIEVFSTIP
jgi:5,10-methylenetetrahydromethanopterin reductase